MPHIDKALQGFARAGGGAAFVELVTTRECVRVGRVWRAGEGVGHLREGAGAVVDAVPLVWEGRWALPVDAVLKRGREAVGWMSVGKQIPGFLYLAGPALTVSAGRLSLLRAALARVDAPDSRSSSWVVDETGDAILWCGQGFPPPSVGTVRVGQNQFLQGAYADIERLRGTPATRFLVHRHGAEWLAESPLSRLSPHQLKVAEYAAAGATVHEIARAMERSNETVKSHLREVYRRLHVGNRVELAEICQAAW